MSITIYAVGVDAGYGYVVSARGLVVHQETMPGVNGLRTMTQVQATKIATLVEQKILGKLSTTVTPNQISAILANRTTASIIADERAGVV